MPADCADRCSESLLIFVVFCPECGDLSSLLLARFYLLCLLQFLLCSEGLCVLHVIWYLNIDKCYIFCELSFLALKNIHLSRGLSSVS